MSDGSAAPADLTIDSTTGIFSLVNKASFKGTYTVDITVVSSDGTVANDVSNTVTNVEIDLVCGTGSTIVTAPSMETLYQIPNYPTPLSLFGSFESSNPTCPVEYLTVTDDCAYNTCIGITLDWIDDDLTTLSGDFTVNVETYANANPDEYHYTVEAYAEGGAYDYADGIMDIQYACVASEQAGYVDDYTFYLPWE